MDVEFWPPRVRSAKHLPLVQAAHLSSAGERHKRSWGQEDFDGLDEHIMSLQRALDKLTGLRLRMCKGKSTFSSNSLGYSEPNRQSESEKESAGDASYGVNRNEDECEDIKESDVETAIDKDNHLDDSEGDDDARCCFPCPFCYMDVEIHALCSHLQEEHCFDFKNAVCPLCAGNLGKDVIGHFMTQHASSLKRRRKSQKSGFWTSTSAMLGRELSSFMGSSTNSRGTAPDPLLSPFLYSASLSGPGPVNIQQEKCSTNRTSIPSDVKSTQPCLLDEGHEQDKEERRQRAAFLQELIASTIY